MTAPEAVSDPELQKVEWDLSHLLDGAGDDPQSAVDALLDESKRRADAFAERYAGKLAELDGSELVRGDARAGRDRGDRRPRRHLRAPVVLDRHRRSRRAARCCSASRRRAPRSRPRCCSSTSSGRRSTTTRAEELLAADGLDFARHHLRDRAPLPPAPADRARGADPHREGAVGPLGLGAAVRGADGGDHGRPRRRRRAGVARDRAGAAVRSGPRGAPRRRRARDRGARSPACAPAPTRSTRCSPTR